jgi:hypothetical protein
VTCGIEEEELWLSVSAYDWLGGSTYLGNDEGLDKHYNAAGDYRSQSNDVETAENVKDDVARTSQGLCLEKCHCEFVESVVDCWRSSRS